MNPPYPSPATARRRTAHQPPAWMSGALCPQVDTEIFFPEKGDSGREAKAVCARCEVCAQCLAYALDHGERHGVWGGKGDRARERMRRDRKASGTPDRGAA